MKAILIIAEILTPVGTGATTGRLPSMEVVYGRGEFVQNKDSADTSIGQFLQAQVASPFPSELVADDW